jgi:secreted PhoX family phosphatase
MADQSKRQFLKKSLQGISVCGVGAVCSNVLLSSCANPRSLELTSEDENGVQLPAGFSSRVIARSNQPVVDGNSYLWHSAPDGGACFATQDGGWIYVSNSEMNASGGVGAIRFDRDGRIVDAYPILENTRRNCAGGATPWGSWLSCEEVDDGLVWECYPEGGTSATARPALGVFNHEAVAVDDRQQRLYLTEDKPDGCLYRFTPYSVMADGSIDLSAGVLEVAVIIEGNAWEGGNGLDWAVLPDPQATQTATRYQVDSAATFNGGEGIVYHDEKIVFTTKGDNRVWSYDINNNHLDILYDAQDSLTPILTGVDNVAVSSDGTLYIAEDGGDMQIVVLDSSGLLYPIVQLSSHQGSEVTGPAFSPDGKRLYFSSQRGETGQSENGVTYEIRGF